MSLFPELKTGKIYKQAPLPFMGQKKNFKSLKKFANSSCNFSKQYIKILVFAKF